MSLQQSPEYIQFILRIGWKTIGIDSSNMIYKKIPFYGVLAKLQRPEKLPDAKQFIQIVKSIGIHHLAIEPEHTVSQAEFNEWLSNIKPFVSLTSTYYLPTKTILVNLDKSEQSVFKSFTEAKQRAVRKATKNGLTTHISQSIDELIAIKNKSAGLFGFITTYGIRHLWKTLGSDQKAILITKTKDGTTVGGVMLIFYEHVSYYWIAGAIKEGKKLAAPSQLVWESVKLSQSKGCKNFDFVGVWDERLPNQYTSWKGFTKFKEGFGGSPMYYPLHK